MTDRLTKQDPRAQYPQPPFPEQPQSAPWGAVLARTLVVGGRARLIGWVGRPVALTAGAFT